MGRLPGCRILAVAVFATIVAINTGASLADDVSIDPSSVTSPAGTVVGDAALRVGSVEGALNLSWDDCGLAGTDTKFFDCRRNTGDVFTLIGEVMTTEVFSVRENDFAFEAIRLMGDRQVRRVPIVGDAGELVGIIAMADIALESEDEREIAETLEEISSGSAFWNKS